MHIIQQQAIQFNGTNMPDPTLNSAYAGQLRQRCPQDSTDASLVVPMDPRTPFVTDVNYYQDILANRGLFTSDQTLLTDSNTVSEVNQNAMSQSMWLRKFAAAMVKMGQIDVVTGTSGEIRTNCRVIN